MKSFREEARLPSDQASFPWRGCFGLREAENRRGFRQPYALSPIDCAPVDFGGRNNSEFPKLRSGQHAWSHYAVFAALEKSCQDQACEQSTQASHGSVYWNVWRVGQRCGARLIKHMYVTGFCAAEYSGLLRFLEHCVVDTLIGLECVPQHIVMNPFAGLIRYLNRLRLDGFYN